MLHSNPTTDALTMMVHYNNKTFIYDNKNNKYYYVILFVQFFSFTSILLVCGLNNHFVLGYILAFLCIGLLQFINRFVHYYKYYTKTAPGLLGQQKIAAELLTQNPYIAQLYVKYINSNDDIEKEALERTYSSIIYLQHNKCTYNKDDIQTILNSEIDLQVQYNNRVVESLSNNFTIDPKDMENDGSPQ